MGVAVEQQLLADLGGQKLEDRQVGGGQLRDQAVMAVHIHICLSQQLIQLMDQRPNLQEKNLL